MGRDLQVLWSRNHSLKTFLYFSHSIIPPYRSQTFKILLDALVYFRCLHEFYFTYAKPSYWNTGLCLFLSSSVKKIVIIWYIWCFLPFGFFSGYSTEIECLIYYGIFISWSLIPVWSYGTTALLKYLVSFVFLLACILHMMFIISVECNCIKIYFSVYYSFTQDFQLIGKELWRSFCMVPSLWVSKYELFSLITFISIY